MTLAQLQSFVLVARLGSVKAAAAELSVTEPAVSVAVAALRRELGDELFVRDGRRIALTPGGRRLAALASEILGLAEQARRSVQESSGQARLMQVAVTNVVA
jgi:LysR family transcriptional regulator, low CO2-responsive transcriptional regulator